MINYLNWRDRPPEVLEAINEAFDVLQSRTESIWGFYNGRESYNLCGINEHELIRQMVLHAPLDQKVFTIIELGAGKFQWAVAVAKFLQSDTILPKDIHINIISTRGERYLGDRVVEVGQCTLYNLGNFKIEELFLQLQEQGFCLTGQVDLCLSHWCMIHLVDPLGTLLQVFELLHCDGWCVMDGFFMMEDEGEILYHFIYKTRMAQVLAATNVAFLIHPHDEMRSLNQFVLQKLGNCQIPMSYAGVKCIGRDRINGSGYITQFQIAEKQRITLKQGDLIGDKQLFNTLRDWEVLRNFPVMQWGSLLRKEDQPIEVFGINDADEEGSTTLLLAVRAGDIEQMRRLIEQGANLNIPNYQGMTPLHEAVLADFEGELIQMLLNAGAQPFPKVWVWLEGDLLARIQQIVGEFDLEAWVNDPLSPLDLARIVSNTRAMELIEQVKGL
jgi:hypothetical protein